MPGIMKKPALLLAVFLAFSASLASADPNPLYEELSRAKDVKIFVKTPVDSGATLLDKEGFKKAVEEALKARKSIRFQPVATEAEAKFVIEIDLKGFGFSLTDPVDMLVGVGMAVVDAAKIAHFASSDVQFTVKDRAGKTRWDGIVHASITDEKMTEEESRQKMPARSAEMFMRAAFGKRK